MTKRTVARRYAKALLIIGKKEKRVQAIDGELSSVLVLFERVPRFWQVINDPLYDLDRRRRVLAEVARIANMSPTVLGLLRLLLEKGRIKYFPLIISVYQEMADEVVGRVRASVYAAMEPSAKEKEKIREKLMKVIGKEVILEATQDPTLIGGMVTKIGGLVLDGSLKTQLARMRENLAKG